MTAVIVIVGYFMAIPNVYSNCLFRFSLFIFSFFILFTTRRFMIDRYEPHSRWGTGGYWILRRTRQRQHSALYMYIGH